MHSQNRSCTIEPGHTPHENKHVPMRMCVICRQRFPKAEIMRYTCPRNDGQELWIDPTGKRSGRGFYVCTNRDCMKKFKKFRGWQKKCRGEHHGN